MFIKIAKHVAGPGRAAGAIVLRALRCRRGTVCVFDRETLQAGFWEADGPSGNTHSSDKSAKRLGAAFCENCLVLHVCGTSFLSRCLGRWRSRTAVVVILFCCV